MASTPPSNLSPNSSAWGRWVEDNIKAIMTNSGRNSNDQSVTNRMLNASINTLAQQVNKAPLGVSNTYIDNSLLAPPSSTTQVAFISFDVPANKTQVNVFAIGSGQYLDKTSGGAAFISGRVGIRMRNPLAGVATDYTYSINQRGAKDAGASAVVNIINPAVSAQFATDGYTVVEIIFEASVSNTSAFTGTSPTNQTQLSATATFTA